MGTRLAIMKKAKKKGKAGGKAKRKKSTMSKKEMNPAEVRQDISKLVTESALELAEAVIEEGMKGQLAPTKYLFELSGVFPVVTDGSITTAHEESLAETLLRKLNIPTVPVKLDADEDEDVVVIPAGAKEGESSTAEGTEEQEGQKPSTTEGTEEPTRSSAGASGE